MFRNADQMRVLLLPLVVEGPVLSRTSAQAMFVHKLDLGQTRLVWPDQET